MPKISELPSTSTVANTDLLVVCVDDGAGGLVTKSAPASAIARPSGTGNEMQYRGNDGSFAAIPGVEGGPDGIDLGTALMRTSGGVAMQYAALASQLCIGGDADGANIHSVLALLASMGLFLSAPALAHSAKQVTAMGTTDHVVNSWVDAVRLADDTPVDIAIWDSANLPANGCFTVVAKVVFASNTHAAEFDLHAKWRDLSPGSRTLVARAIEDEDSVNPDGVAAEFVEDGTSLVLRLTGTSGGAVRVGYEVDAWMTSAP